MNDSRCRSNTRRSAAAALNPISEVGAIRFVNLAMFGSTHAELAFRKPVCV
jgi:hypothetical protein